MNVINKYQTPNIPPLEIDVEFLILHYTACDLEKTLEIFLDQNRKVSSHFVLDTNGDLYDLGNFLSGPIYQGAHAGVSRIEVDGKVFEAINTCSIGIEIINLNGNIFAYTDAQYDALIETIKKLQKRFPKLLDANRIVGHEHIAFFRGKVDPGLMFDWHRVFKGLGMEPAEKHHFFACDKEDQKFLQAEISREMTDRPSDFWPDLSLKLEQRIAAKMQAVKKK